MSPLRRARMLVFNLSYLSDFYRALGPLYITEGAGKKKYNLSEGLVFSVVYLQRI